MKRRIRLTESDLHRIVKESVERIVAESIEEGTIGNFFNNFRRTIPVNNVGRGIGTGGQRYRYDSKTGKYVYTDERGNEHDTGVGYGDGRVGTNWNPFKSTTGRQVSRGDADAAKRQLRQWNNTEPERIRQNQMAMNRIEDSEKRMAAAEAQRQERNRMLDKQAEANIQRSKQYKDPIGNYMGSNPLNH